MNQNAITCPTCGYDLRATPNLRCPECGSFYRPVMHPPPRLRDWFISAGIMLAACYPVFFVAVPTSWLMIENLVAPGWWVSCVGLPLRFFSIGSLLCTAVVLAVPTYLGARFWKWRLWIGAAFFGTQILSALVLRALLYASS